MMMMLLKKKDLFYVLTFVLFIFSCSEKDPPDPGPGPGPTPSSFSFSALKVNNQFNGFTYTGITPTPVLKFSFSAPLNRNTIASSVSFNTATGTAVQYNISYENNDSTLVITPSGSLSYLTKYVVTTSTNLKSTTGGSLLSPISINLMTGYDLADKFPQITDSALLNLVQEQTFKYFWDFGHPVSGLARERNTSGDVVTSGGSGFGIMSIVVGIHRQFITRAEGLARMQKIVGFLKNTAETFHGAFPHWLNGTTGKAVPFSTKDNGADLVETSYLIQGLLTARQYFNGSDATETALRNDINELYADVEWDWFRKGGENVLYWHWSPNYSWEMNHQIRGWNECLITYVLAASSPSHSIPKIVYDNGWARNGAIRNGNTYLGIPLPLGEPYGGPLFFAHYSFLGINPKDLTDAYANYWTQNTNHSKINHAYCRANPRGFYGYSDSCWGLTASDIPNGYTASSPTNDVGVIAPTAALSSMPYTPEESMKALKFFYYKLGDRIWKQYGFVDAFSLSVPWFASSHLAIDQGPIIIMIENHRSGLLWDLFMSCPEIKTGMRNLGFQSPKL